ncbi:nnf1a [Cochliomyia hominivorax]
MSQLQNTCSENIEANYDKYKDFGDKVFQKYVTIYKQMWSKLNPTHLEPFAKILMERENIVLKGQDELTETIRNNLQKQMQQALQNFWQSNGVSEALISLELCKEKFKSYEGHKWNMDAKTPWERTRPIRMRFKENRLRYLQEQLNFQNKELEKVLQENIGLRKHIQDVKHERVHLLETIANIRKENEEARMEIIKLQEEIFAENGENNESNDETEC